MERPRSKNIFTNAPLLDLYGELPPVSCTSCGKCCASPHITFVESLHLFRWLFDAKSVCELETLFNAETIAQKFAFNFKCRFEDSQTKLCGVHPARGFVCRVFGYPVLDRMGIDRMDNCREPDRPLLPDVKRSRMQDWLDRLADLNRIPFPSFNRPPYHITGFNIETWLDIAQTDYGRHPFTVYHRLLCELPFDQLSLDFSDRTHLSTRLAKIDLFHQAEGIGDRKNAIHILENLLTSEPMTGTFFRYEARRYLDGIRDSATGCATRTAA